MTRETDVGWAQVQKAIRGSADTPVTLTVERDGDRRDLTVTPIENTVYADPESDAHDQRRLRRRQPGADLRAPVGHRGAGASWAT